MGLTIEQMRLAPIMEARARDLQIAFPGLVDYTSGRRSVFDQAQAMAVNHLRDPVSYLRRTYVHAQVLLDALSMAASIRSVSEVTQVFYEAMIRNPTAVDSPHLEGNAVDLQPMEDEDGEMTKNGLKVVVWIRACADTVDFRTREGNLPRWHWACRASLEKALV